MGVVMTPNNTTMNDEGGPVTATKSKAERLAEALIEKGEAYRAWCEAGRARYAAIRACDESDLAWYEADLAWREADAKVRAIEEEP